MALGWDTLVVTPSLTPPPEPLLKIATYDFEKREVALQACCLTLKG